MKKYLYYIIFFFILLIPVVCYPLVKPWLDQTNYENRELEKIPKFSIASWPNYTKEIDTYIENNFMYKNQFIAINRGIDLKVFNNLDVNNVMLGKEKWLFHKEGEALRQYRGSVKWKEDELKNLATQFNLLEKECLKRNSDLIFLIAPNKENIYGDMYLPNYAIRDKNIEDSTQILVEYLKKHTNITVIYPKEELQSAIADGKQTYYKYDTHWNKIGGYIASNVVLKEVGMSYSDYAKFTLERGAQCGGDLSTMLGVPYLFNDDVEWDVEEKSNLSIATLINEEENGLPMITREYRSELNNEKSLLVVGDSFANFMQDDLAPRLKRTSFIHYDAFEKDMLDYYDPDIVVIECVERMLGDLESILQ